MIQIFIFVTVIVIVLIALTNRSGEQNRLKENHIVVCGIITDINDGRGGNYLIKYSYYYFSKKFQSSGFCSASTNDRFNNGTKEILVVVEKSDPRNSEIIQDAQDFDKFNITKDDTAGMNCDDVLRR